MVEPQSNDISDLFRTSVGLKNRKAGQKAIHRKPVGLTITVEKIDRVLLADVQAQIENPRQD